MAAPPGNGLRNVNSIMMEMALHLVEPCIIATAITPVAIGASVTINVSSVVGMYAGAQGVISNADGSNPTLFTVNSFDPIALTMVGSFTAVYSSGSILLGATFPTQQPSDPLFTQVEIIGYVARAQNEFLSKMPGVFEFVGGFPLTTGQTFYPLPSRAVELERVAIRYPNGGANIVSVNRVNGLVTAVFDADSRLPVNNSIIVSGVGNSTFNGSFSSITVSTDGLSATWQQFDGSPDATSAGGSFTWQVLSRLYEVTQNELAMRDPQWFYNTSNPVPASWYEDRTGIYGWGVAGVPQSNFEAELLFSARDDEALLLTDHFIVPDVFLHFVKYKALEYAWSKSGEQRSPSMARYCAQRFDKGLLIADRYLRNLVQAPQ